MRTMHISLAARLFALSVVATTTTTCSAFTTTSVPVLLRPLLTTTKKTLTSTMTDLRTAATTTTTTTTTTQLDALPEALVMAGSMIATSLQSGQPTGVLGLTAIASTVILPLVQYRNLYGISVGYGLSVASMGLALRRVFNIVPLSIQDLSTAATIFYGLRLASFLFIRDLSGSWKPPVTRPEPARLQRIPFALSLALFYAFMVTPVLYVCRAAPLQLSAATQSVRGKIAIAGVCLAWVGALLEATADTHKFVSKLRNKNEDQDASTGTSNKLFTGPSSGVFGWTRHPNYTGEVLFWLGTFVTGIPFFEKTIFGYKGIGWLASSAGLYGIVTIMFGATKRLEKRHAENYGGQEAYENWKKKVPATLIPFWKN